MFLVTRPQPKAKETCDALLENNLQAMALPVIAIKLLERVDVPIRPYDGIIITSTYVQEWLSKHLLTMLDTKTKVICVGSACADMVFSFFEAEHNIHQQVHIAKPENSEGVIELAARIFNNHDKVALVKGAGGRGLISKAILQRGLSLDIFDIYERQRINASNAFAEIEHHTDMCIIVSSVDIAKHLIAQCSVDWLQQQSWMATSPRIKKYLETQGMQNIYVSHGASVNAIITCAKQI